MQTSKRIAARASRVGGAGGAIDEISSALHSMGTARGPGGASTPMPPPLGSMGGSAQSGPGQPPQKDIKDVMFRLRQLVVIASRDAEKLLLSAGELVNMSARDDLIST